MTIGEIYSTTNYLTAKNFSGRTFTPDEFNLIYPETELTFFRTIARPPADQLHSWRTLQPAVDDIRLQTLKKEFTLTIVNTKADLPNIDNSETEFLDWLSFGLAVTIKDNCDNDVASELPVEVVVDDEWSTRLAAAIRKPTLKFPILKFIQETNRAVQVAPSAINQLKLRYYKKPRKPVFAFTADANDNIIYDATLSVQSEFADVVHEQIINFLLEKVSTNLTADAPMAYSQLAKQQG